MAAAIVRHIGARHVVVTDINDYRLDLAATMGATRTVNVAKQKLEDEAPERIDDLVDFLVAFADPILDGTAETRMWDPSASAWRAASPCSARAGPARRLSGC